MKKMILSLMSATLGCAAFAANCVSVQQVSTDCQNRKVTFTVTWDDCANNGTCNRTTAWVFVDYCAVQADDTKGTWTRAAISGTSAGTVHAGSGIWLSGTNPQTVTLDLDLPANLDKFDWCAFATGTPPRVIANSGGIYTFGGTPPFVLSNATAQQIVNGTTLSAAALTLPLTTPITITDATGCPGSFCLYTGCDLFMNATHACQQRTSGAQNWEAYIKDVRDEKLYKIIQGNNGWIFAGWLNYNAVGLVCGSGGIYSNDDNDATMCPAGWVVPNKLQFTQFGSSRADYHTYYGFLAAFTQPNYPTGYPGSPCYNNANTHIHLSDCDQYVWWNEPWRGQDMTTFVDWRCTDVDAKQRVHCFRAL